MSSQSTPGLSFSIAANPSPFRLLELPPELLHILTSSNPPALHFKSAASKDAVNNAEAVLCTPDKTFFMRQQQTSNGVHIVTPTLTNSNGITAISQCTSSLELMAAPADSARSTMRNLLPVFIDYEDANRSLPEFLSKTDIFADTPMSHAECQKAWVELVAFEIAPSATLPSRCFRPSAHVLLGTWLRLMDIVRSEGINLAGTLRTSTVLEALWNPDEESPHELRLAILNRLTSNHEFMSNQHHAETALRDGSTLDRATTVEWLGLLILQSHLESSPASPYLQKDAFLESWKDALPEDWRDDAKLDALPKHLHAVAADHVRFKQEGIDHALGDVASASPISNPAEAKSGNKRKWHEKFAAARKQGKR